MSVSLPPSARSSQPAGTLPLPSSGRAEQPETPTSNSAIARFLIVCHLTKFWDCFLNRVMATLVNRSGETKLTNRRIHGTRTADGRPQPVHSRLVATPRAGTRRFRGDIRPTDQPLSGFGASLEKLSIITYWYKSMAMLPAGDAPVETGHSNSRLAATQPRKILTIPLVSRSARLVSGLLSPNSA